MELLNREQERAIRLISRYEGVPANREPLEAAVGDWKVLAELEDLGYARFASSVADGSDFDYRHVKLTSDGRCYFHQKRRDIRRRWAPVLVSAAIGATGTLLGVIATLLLA